MDANRRRLNLVKLLQQSVAAMQFLVEQLRMLTGKVVAVVGLAHLDGIEERWHQMEN